LSRIFLVRHGQAGTRQSYDSLSDLGVLQSRLLAEHFVKTGVRFHSAWAGSLVRQQGTAREVRDVFAEQGIDFPALAIDEGWNEFDLEHVYRELAPALCEEDEDFRREYESMKAEIHAAADESGAEVHRRWTPCDIRIVQAWIKGHPRYVGESWLAFHRRVAQCRARLAPETEESDDHNVIVFTSGTPIGIWAALGMDVEDHRAMRLAGVLHNASYTVVRLRGEHTRLHMFNAVPHLEPHLRTYR